MIKSHFFKFTLYILLISKFAFADVNVMAPLMIDSESKWQEFEQRLISLKKNGVESISTDVWWGLVEKKYGNYDWSVYKRMAKLIKNAGLKWTPIMSFHQCGGNVGDDCNIPIPKWVWEKSKKTKIMSLFSEREFQTHSDTDIQYLSELGQRNNEHPSVWSSPHTVQYYKNFLKSFISEFSDYQSDINEINISLGAAGELRYPSYNSHDQGQEKSIALFPNRGSFQGMSELAKFSFNDYMQIKYQTNKSYKLPSMEEFSDLMDNGLQNTELGKDIFDWYQASLFKHGEIVLTELDKIKSQTLFRSIPLGSKVPGIHWNMGIDHGLGEGFTWSHRLSEMTAGLISSNDKNLLITEKGAGYDRLLSHLARIRQKIQSPFILHFTCLEMNNNDNANMKANSMAKSLVHWFGNQTRKHDLKLKGENALEGLLYQKQSWKNIKDAIDYSHYSGLTILRMGPLTDNEQVQQEIKNLDRHLKKLKAKKIKKRKYPKCFSLLRNF